MQRAGFALPTFLVVPVTIIFLNDSCSARLADACFMSNFLSKELFWNCQPRVISFWSWEFWFTPQNWIWLGWLLAQFWISIHLWTPKHERLTRSEKYGFYSCRVKVLIFRLFVLTYYNSFFIDQALAFNRRRDDNAKIRAEVT
jgi:chitin synthase